MRNPKVERRRNGVALAAALICVVLMSAIVAGAFIAATEEIRMSGNSVSSATLLNAAESAVENQITHWVSAVADSVPIGAIRTVAVGASGASTTWLIRLDSALFWVVAESRGSDVVSGLPVVLRQRVGVLVRASKDSSGATAVFPLDRRSWSLLY